MSDSPSGMSRRAAFRLEMAIIGLGVVALVLIFQPVSLPLFSVGCGLVVLAGLVINLLPMAQPGVPARSVTFAAVLVAMIFCIVLLVSIGAAHLYGAAFLKPPAVSTTPTPPAAPFWGQPLVWGLAAVAAVLAGLVTLMSRRSP
jgi:hypothetical protein